jgi:hypothetical protein
MIANLIFLLILLVYFSNCATKSWCLHKHLPQVGHAIISTYFLITPLCINNCLAMIGSISGRPDMDTLIVLPIPNVNNGAQHNVCLIVELINVPASVTPKWSGYLIFKLASLYKSYVNL